ncbi:MAG: LacI family DNA-binding transcriptional regulator, partial [Clostridia bacterium]
MKTTVKQLAEHCGVSIGTIDRVLNNRKGVSASTKELVHKAIVELHYSPNYMAKSLSMQRSLSIGVVLFNLKNSYFGQLAEAMVSEATQLGYSAYLMLSQKSKEQERSCIANLISRRV